MVKKDKDVMVRLFFVRSLESEFSKEEVKYAVSFFYLDRFVACRKVCLKIIFENDFFDCEAIMKALLFDRSTSIRDMARWFLRNKYQICDFSEICVNYLQSKVANLPFVDKLDYVRIIKSDHMYIFDLFELHNHELSEVPRNVFSKYIENIVFSNRQNYLHDNPLVIYRIATFNCMFKSMHKDFYVSKLLLYMIKEVSYTRGFRDISKSLIFIELKKALLFEKPSLFFNFLKRSGCLEHSFPDIHKLVNVPQRPDYHPEGCCYNHTMMVLDCARALSMISYSYQCFSA